MLRKPLVHKNKRRARAALYLAPAAVLVIVLAVTWVAGRLDPACDAYRRATARTPSTWVNAQLDRCGDAS